MYSRNAKPSVGSIHDALVLLSRILQRIYVCRRVLQTPSSLPVSRHSYHTTVRRTHTVVCIHEHKTVRGPQARKHARTRPCTQMTETPKKSFVGSIDRRRPCVVYVATVPVTGIVHILQHIYGDGAYQAGQYPSPYQARHRVHSKHGSRGYKRRANSSAGGDGVAAAYGAGGGGAGGGGAGSGLGLALASSSSHPRGRSERDRFLVDINGGGQRSGATPNALLHARTHVRGLCDVWHILVHGNPLGTPR